MPHKCLPFEINPSFLSSIMLIECDRVMCYHDSHPKGLLAVGCNAVIVGSGGVLLYFIFSGLNWIFFFDKDYLKHPKKLDNQVQREILTTLGSIPFMTALTAPVFLLEVITYKYVTPTPASIDAS